MHTSKDKQANIRIQDLKTNTTMRYFADKLFGLAESIPTQQISMDFADVEFVSRSFVQQYLLRKKHSSKQVIEKNQSEDVKRMFLLVERNQRSNQRFDFDKWEVRELPA